MPREATRAIHGGEEAVEGISSFVTPIYQTAVFPIRSTLRGPSGGPLKYSREGDLTNVLLERRLIRLSIGFEDVNDLIEEISQALARYVEETRGSLV
jgi:cystathionine beta-lyase/cystathionine gamma-synthase